MTGFEVSAFRSHFPALESGVAFFDAPAGTQTPLPVAQAIAGTLTRPLSNRGQQSVSEQNAEQAVAEFRAAYADLLGADPAGIVYGRSATQLTYDFAKHLSQSWGPGDEVVVTRLDHDANIRPWVQSAERSAATVRWADFDPATGELDTNRLIAALNKNTRLVAITAASNVLGTMPDVARIAEAAHQVGALVYVDGVHHTAHDVVDVQALGADFFICSPYKFLGPHCAVLAASPELLELITPEKLLPATNDVPERFEYGTLPYEVMAGATAAVDFLARFSSTSGSADGQTSLSRREQLISAHQATSAHERRLAHRVEAAIHQHFYDDVVLHSRAQRRTPTLLLTFPGRSATDVSASLHAHGIHAPAGSFYAYEPSRRLDLPEGGGLRLGMAPYTHDDDVDRLLDALTRALAD